MSQDDGCPANTGDMEGEALRVILILEYQVYNLHDVSSFVGSPIYIVNWDCSGQMLGL